jgi:hypothetical protein
LSQQIEALGWFVPAAQYMYFLLIRRGRRGALAAAVRRAAALPLLPQGWKRDTRADFLAHLALVAPPECPQTLREDLLAREQAGRSVVPPRIARLIMASPSRARRRCFEARVEDLALVPFAAIAETLAQSEPGATCRLTLELL